MTERDAASILETELTEAESAAGLALDDPKVRNRIVNAGLVRLNADSNTTADSDIVRGAGAGIADIAITDITVNSDHDTEAYVGDSTLNLSGALELKANGTAEAIPTASNGAGAGVFTLGKATVRANTEGKTSAGIDAGATVEATNVLMQAIGSTKADASTTNGGGSLVASISLLDSYATDSGSAIAASPALSPSASAHCAASATSDWRNAP